MNTTKPTLGEVVEGRQLVTVAEDATIVQAAKKMMESKKGAVLVTGGGRLRGIFTERDMVQRVVAVGVDPALTKIREVMTDKLVAGAPHENHAIALRRMVTAGCRHLPVVEGTKVIGMVSRRELMALDIDLLEGELDRHDPSHLFI